MKFFTNLTQIEKTVLGIMAVGAIIFAGGVAVTCSAVSESIDEVGIILENRAKVDQQCHDCCPSEEFGLNKAKECYEKCREYVRTFTETDDTAFVPQHCDEIQQEFSNKIGRCTE